MKHSTFLFALLFAAFSFFTSCNYLGKPIYGNHQLVNQRINIGDYEKVILKIPAEVFYQQFSDSTPYLQIHTDENIFEALNVRVENNQLIIEAKKDSIIKPSQLTIYTCSHNISQVEIAGSGKIRLKGEVNSKDLDLGISGSGNLLADSLICERINASISGSGDIQLKGASAHSTFSIAGSGTIHAFDYLVQDLNCKIAGSGNVEALVIKKLTVHIAGSGDFSYRGLPESIEQYVAGSGKIKSVD